MSESEEINQDSPQNQIYNIGPGKQIIKKPVSVDLLNRLRAKLKEYRKRIGEKEKGWDWTIDAAYNALILKAVLDQPQSGEITLKEVDDQAWLELVNGEMDVAGITHFKVLPQAWLTIWSYIYEQGNVTGGTGL